MAVVIELLNKGLVTARDPALLRSGELQRCDDCIYHPNDQAIWKAPGRATFASQIDGRNSPVKGIRYLDFDKFGEDRGDDFVIAHVSGSATGLGSYYYSVVATSKNIFPPAGDFASLTTAAGDGRTLDAAHYGNRYYMFNGNLTGVRNIVIKPNLVADGAPQYRSHGMEAVTTVPIVVSASGAGWLPTDQSFGDGFYFFITTEVINPRGVDEVESTWAGKEEDFALGKGLIQVSGVADGVTITMPTRINDGVAGRNTATHWRIYLAGPYTTTNWNQSYLMAMYLQDTVPIATTARTIGSTITDLGTFRGTAIITATAQVPNPWDNASLITNDGGGAATGDQNGESIIVSAFGLPTASITGTVWGINVLMSLKADNPKMQELDVQLYHSGVSAYSTSMTHMMAPEGGWKTKVVGGNADPWGLTWTNANFTDALFKVKVTYRKVIGGDPYNTDVDVDWIRVGVNAGAAMGLTKGGAMFPYTAIQVGSVVTVVGSNGPPPVASTGDIYEGQMVVNDVGDPGKIWYSLPDAVDYFPSIYFVSFETKENDAVTFIRRLGDKLIVGLKHQLYRVNYLPRGEDSEFDRGRCYEAISEDHGIVGLQAGALFSPPDRGQLLAYVSTNGIHATDGFTTTTLTEDLDWERMVNVSQLHRSILINFPKYSSLVLYYIPYEYIPVGMEEIWPHEALWFNYHPSHIKEGGKLLVSGPVKMGELGGQMTCAAHVGKFLNEPFLMTSRNYGYVFVEDVGFDDAGDLGIVPDIVTRDIYAAGIGYEYTIERLWFRHYQHIPVSTINVTPYWKNTEGEYTTPVIGPTYTQKSFTTEHGGVMPGTPSGLINGGSLSRIDQHLIGESFAFRMQGEDSGSGMAISWMAMEAEGHGLEEKR